MSAPTATPTTGLRERHADVIEKIMSKYPTRRSGVMDVLYLVQDELGWIPPETMPEIAEICEIEPAEVMEMVSFYTMYHRKPVGKHVLWVCGTLPCALCGSDGLMKYLQEKLGCGMDTVSSDGEFTIKRAECLGACSEAPLLLVDGQMQTRLTRAKVDDMIERLRSGKPLEKPAAASPDPGMTPGTVSGKAAPKKSAPTEVKVVEKPVEKAPEPAPKPAEKPAQKIQERPAAKVEEPEPVKLEPVKAAPAVEALKAAVEAPVIAEAKPVAKEAASPVEAVKLAEPVSAKIVEIAPPAEVMTEKAVETIADPVPAPKEEKADPPVGEVKAIEEQPTPPATMAGVKDIVKAEMREVAAVETKEVTPVEAKTIAKAEPKLVAKLEPKQIVRKAQTLPAVGEEKKARQAQVVVKPKPKPTGPSKTVAVYRRPSSGEDAPPERPAPIEVTEPDMPTKKPRAAIVQKVLEKKAGGAKQSPLPKLVGSFTDRVLAAVKASHGGEPPKEPSLPKRDKIEAKSEAPRAAKEEKKKEIPKKPDADKGKTQGKNGGGKKDKNGKKGKKK